MTVPQHLLVINFHFDPDSYGGATIVANSVAHHIAKTGIRVSAIATMHDVTLPPYTVVRSLRGAVETYRLNLPGTGGALGPGYRDPAVDARMAELITHLQPDLVHAHCLQGLGIGVLHDLEARNIPFILSIHDYWWICQRQFMVRPTGRYCGQDPVRVENCAGCVPQLAEAKQRFEALRAIAARAQAITYPSRFTQNLCARSGLTAPRQVYWENGITGPGKDFFDTQADWRAKRQRVTFGYVGGPSFVKGWPLVRAAFQKLRRNDLDGVIVDASADGSLWSPGMLSGMNGNWQIRPRYSQAGMDGFFAEIDVLLFVSQWREAFGLTACEAFSRGVRVIQTAGGASSEHAGADPNRQLPLGAPPSELAAMIHHELDHPNAHPQPQAFRSFEAQAEEFLTLIGSL